MIAAGGTGGHVFPALALGIELRDRGAAVVWAGRREGFEYEVAAEHRFAFEPLAATGFYGKGIGIKVRALWQLMVGFWRALGLLDRVKPDGVVATGGFATAAVLGATRFGRTPMFLLEQNCIPGRVTRFFAPSATRSFLTFPTEKPYPGPSEVIGCPLRRDIVGWQAEATAGAEPQAAVEGNTVLVLGGSLGARALNEAAIAAAAALPQYHFVILSGRRDYVDIKERAASANCEVVEFTSHPEELYRRAAIAVSRAGGVVLSELLAFGVPGILVPYPFATDKHQDANARYLASVGAAFVLDEERLAELPSAIEGLMADEQRRRLMRSAARLVARPNAAAAIAERIIECLAD